MNDDIRGIVRSQRVLDEVHKELDNRALDPLEEDFIFTDGFGFSPGEPRVIEVAGVPIEVRVLHRKGLAQSDIKGADLLYEISGWKFALVQYKSPNTADRIENDPPQLKRLMEACMHPCPPSSPAVWPYCGSWYAIRGKSGGQYMPACAAWDAFAGAKSKARSLFTRGVSQPTFRELFARCYIGSRTAPAKIAFLTWSTLEDDRVLFAVTQFGSFGR